MEGIISIKTIHNIIVAIYHKNAFSLLTDDKIIEERGDRKKKMDEAEAAEKEFL